MPLGSSSFFSYISLFFISPCKVFVVSNNVPVIFDNVSVVPPNKFDKRDESPFVIPIVKFLGPLKKFFLGSFNNSNTPIPIDSNNFIGFPKISNPNIILYI